MQLYIYDMQLYIYDPQCLLLTYIKSTSKDALLEIFLHQRMNQHLVEAALSTFKSAVNFDYGRLRA